MSRQRVKKDKHARQLQLKSFINYTRWEKEKNCLGSELLDQSNVLLLGLIRGKTLLLAPGIPLGLALEVSESLFDKRETISDMCLSSLFH